MPIVLASQKHGPGESSSGHGVVGSDAGATVTDGAGWVCVAGEQADITRAVTNNPAAPKTADFVFMS